MEFRNAYERVQHKGQIFSEPTLAQQQFRDECDVNVVIDRYTKTGVVPSELVNSAQGVYGDFSNVGDFMSMQNALIKARESFDELPSAIRSRFDDDPAKLIAFVKDKSNYDEAVKLGLVDKVVNNVDKAEASAPAE